METKKTHKYLIYSILTLCITIGSWEILAQDNKEPPQTDEDIIILREYEVKAKRITVYYDKKIRAICHITDAGHISCLPYQPQLWPEKGKNFIREQIKNHREKQKEKEKEEINE